MTTIKTGQAGLALPPHNIEAEEALLGSILIDERAYLEVTGIIDPVDFYLVKHRWLFEAFVKLSAARMPIDLLTMQEALERAGQLNEIGGPAYLTRLITLTPSAYNAGGYARLVKEAADRRRLIQMSSDIARLAYDVGADIESIKQQAARAFIASNPAKGGAVHVSAIASELYDDVVSLAENPRDLIGMDSGFADYNAGSGGVHRGECMLIVGKPGVGKSLFAAQIAHNLARAGHPGAVYEMEMKNRSIVRRWVSADSSVPTRKMRTGRMNDDDWLPFTESITRVSQLPIYLSEATHWTTASLRADLTRLVSEYGVQWFMLDYFDRLKDRARDDLEAQKIKSIGITDICKDLSLAGIVIHTLNKAGMRAQDESLADVSGNRQIIYDADQVVYFTEHKPQYGEPENQSMRTVRFGKFREENVRASFDLVLIADVPKFADVAWRDLPTPRDDPAPPPYPD